MCSKIFSNSIFFTNFPWFWQWKKVWKLVNIWTYKAYKKCAKFLGHPVYLCVHYAFSVFVCRIVVVFCHSYGTITGRFLFRAQDLNMTNGDFAFFTFDAFRSMFTDHLWYSYTWRMNIGEDDLQKRLPAFYAVKQVFIFFTGFFVYH